MFPTINANGSNSLSLPNAENKKSRLLDSGCKYNSLTWFTGSFIPREAHAGKSSSIKLRLGLISLVSKNDFE